jgi:hypothetical protein
MKNNYVFANTLIIFSLLFLFSCEHSINPSRIPSDYFVMNAPTHDSTGYCYFEVLPKPDTLTIWCAETLHAKDTTGSIYVTNDTEDNIAPIPAGLYGYVLVPVMDSTDCTSGTCKYWVRGIQIDSVVNWIGIGNVCSFQGHPVAIVNSPKTKTIWIGYPADTVKITYRDSINTPDSSIRNEIIAIQRSTDMRKISITPSSLPNGITVTDFVNILPTSLINHKSGQVVFKINTLTIQKGICVFKFNINIDGKDYRDIPCTLNIY